MDKGFQIQEWDTNFFGFRVIKIKEDFLNENPVKKLKDLYHKNVKLAYYSSGNSDFERLKNNFYDVTLVYTRIPIIKEVKTLTKVHPNISSYECSSPSKEIISLARLAGKEGRFGRDSRISDEIYNEIFKQWITNSTNRTIADDVLVYKVEGKVVGFGTIKIDGENGYAPLFAVNRKFEGKGVSFALMRAIENSLIENNCKYLVSGTQKINSKALTSFKRFGFEFQAHENVYHLWKKN